MIFHRNGTIACILTGLVLAVFAASGTHAGDNAAVLDTTGFWRMHHTLDPVLVETGEGLRPVSLEYRWLNKSTTPPPDDWHLPEFDDTGWFRGPLLRSLSTPLLSQVNLRGRFTVTDIDQVGDLYLDAAYRGGIIVHLNGVEILRRNVAGESNEYGLLAESYPDEAFLDEDGSVLGEERWGNRLEVRTRRLDGETLPRELLREGVNTLAVGIVRAPYHPELIRNGDGEYVFEWSSRVIDLPWNTCEVEHLRLEASSPDGLAPNAVRTEGLQVWNQNLMTADFDMDYGDPNEPLRPVRIAGARNGTFSGKVIVSSTDPIRGLEVLPGELRGAGDEIPASAVRVRYGLPWGGYALNMSHVPALSPKYPRSPSFLGALADEALGEFPVRTRPPGRGDLETPGRPDPVFGAVAPVWISVEVPAEAAAGSYEGTIVIRAEGEDPVEVGVNLEVADWTLPDPPDYRTWVELIQSPDTLALEYELEPWSEDHFELIARSMDYLGEIGNRTVYVPLIAGTNFGNEHSMVRWIPDGEGGYGFDLSVMERYLDVVLEHMGEPEMVIFPLWDVYMIHADDPGAGAGAQQQRIFRHLEGTDAVKDSGPVVTIADGGELRNETLPRYTAPGSADPWRELFGEIRRKMNDRGLEDAMSLGMLTDAFPTREEVEVLKDVSGNLPWIAHSHHTGTGTVYGTSPIRYAARVWNISYASNDPPGAYMAGWAREDLLAQFTRTPDVQTFPFTRWRHITAINITGCHRGSGRLGADYWQAVRDGRGRRRGRVYERYPQSSWRNLDIYTSLLAPGPDGPVATTRFEMLREGVQLDEARIAVERALIDDELRELLGEELAAECDDLLYERRMAMFRGMSPLRLTGANHRRANAWRGRPGIEGHIWFLGSGWMERDLRLYELAGKVSEKLDRR